MLCSTGSCPRVNVYIQLWSVLIMEVTTGRFRKTSLPARMLSEQAHPKLLGSNRISLPVIKQSAYRPLSRPAPRLSQVTPPQHSELGLPPWARAAQRAPKQPLSASFDGGFKPVRPDILVVPTSPTFRKKSTDKEKQADVPMVSKPSKEIGAEKAGGASAAGKLLSPTGRPKSGVRRRPRQQRRSTGITYEADEDVPDELEGLVTRKSPDQDGLPSPDSIPDETSEYRADSPTNEDIARLKQILEAEESKEQRLQGELTKAQTDLDSYKAKVLELNGRYEAASKVYDQERTAKDKCNVRLAELEEGSQTLQAVQNENQRLRDESTSLIRVINRLSKPSA